MSFNKHLAFIFAILIFETFARDLPSYIERCSLSDPKLNECLKNSIGKAASSILNGDKNFNIPKLLPISIPFVEISVGPDLKMKFSNASAVVFNNLEVIDANFDDKTGKFYMEFTDDQLDSNGIYEMDIKLFGLAIKGNGPALINCTGITMTYTTFLKPITKKGTEYYTVNDGKLTFTPKSANFLFKNLFNGDENLGAATNKLFNEDWQTFFKIFQPTIEKILGAVIENTFKQYLKYVPKEQIFLP